MKLQHEKLPFKQTLQTWQTCPGRLVALLQKQATQALFIPNQKFLRLVDLQTCKLQPIRCQASV
jgi:hypothetical protein